VQRSHKIRLSPNNVQATYFAKAAGCSRLAYNWGLAKWKSLYESGEKPTALSVKKIFNSVKREEFPFVYEITKWGPEQAFRNLDSAFKRFFKTKKGYPKFKKKGVHDSFYISGTVLSVDENRVKIPKLGWVKMTEPLRYDGKIVSAVVSRKADWWFVSISVKVDDSQGNSENQTAKPVGIDFGVSKFATLSGGTVFENPRVTEKFSSRLRLLNKSLSRKVKGSNRFRKAKLKLQRLHVRISDYRNDAIHKFSRHVADNYTDVCLEDLNVSGMVRNHKLSKAIVDVSFREARRQLEYKCQKVHIVDRWFPSTKTCFGCGAVNDMKLSDRVFGCECGVKIDRDLNAAQNILRQGLPYKCVERPALATWPVLSYETGLWEARNSPKRLGRDSF
jgi:putative transposase